MAIAWRNAGHDEARRDLERRAAAGDREAVIALDEILAAEGDPEAARNVRERARDARNEAVLRDEVAKLPLAELVRVADDSHDESKNLVWSTLVAKGMVGQNEAWHPASVARRLALERLRSMSPDPSAAVLGILGGDAARARRVLGLDRLPRGMGEVARTVREKRADRVARRAAEGLDRPEVPFLERLERRLEDRTADAVREAYERCDYRKARGRWAGGGHDLTVEIGHPGCTGGARRVWSQNRKWRGLDSFHRVTVPRDWSRTVGQAGIAVVDGSLVLEAEPAERPHGARGALASAASAWRATRARQGQGFLLVPEPGWVAADAAGNLRWVRG